MWNVVTKCMKGQYHCCNETRGSQLVVSGIQWKKKWMNKKAKNDKQNIKLEKETQAGEQ